MNNFSLKLMLKLQLIMLVLWFFIGGNLLAYAQEPNRVNIISPTNGDEVGKRGVVKFRVMINDGRSHPWVIVHMKLLGNKWWPQEKPVCDNGVCQALVTYGVKDDINFDFEIAVATFTGQAHRMILNYHREGIETNKWPPMPFPEKTSNVDIVTVTKTSH